MNDTNKEDSEKTNKNSNLPLKVLPPKLLNVMLMMLHITEILNKEMPNLTFLNKLHKLLPPDFQD